MRKVFVAALAFAACTPFRPGNEDPPADVNLTEAGAPDAPDGSVPTTKEDAGPSERPSVGQGCGGRFPAPNVCDDYEHGLPAETDLKPSNTKSSSDLAIGLVGSGSAHGLHATVAANVAGHAYAVHPIPAPETVHYVAYTYDLHVDASLAPNTELVQLLGTCSLQTRLEKMGELDLNEYCESGGSRMVASLTLPDAGTASWVNIYVAVDFTTRDVTMSMRLADGRALEQRGTIMFMKLDARSTVQPGIGYYFQSDRSTTVDIDNFAAFWR